MVSAPLSQPGITKDSKERLRLWIRLLRASRTIEAELRERLKKEYDTTLPRFDVMAALFRVPEGMLMSDLSRFLLVSNGNVTGIVDRLEAAGLAERRPAERDRRVKTVVLTPHGEAVREEVRRRAGTPPPEIAALSEEDAAILRDVLRRAVGAGLHR